MDEFRLSDEDRGCSNKYTILSSKEDRLFYMFGDINARNCSDLAYDITLINMEDNQNEEREKNFERKPIRLYINSFGGSVYNMWLLIDTILGSKTPIHTICNGYAMSAAFQIFLAGHKRYISDHASLMYHQIYCWRSGKYQDLVEDRQHMDHLNSQIENFVIARTKLSKEALESIREKKRDTYFTSEEALELGMAEKMENIVM